MRSLAATRQFDPAGRPVLVLVAGRQVIAARREGVKTLLLPLQNEVNGHGAFERAALRHWRHPGIQSELFFWILFITKYTTYTHIYKYIYIYYTIYLLPS